MFNNSFTIKQVKKITIEKLQTLIEQHVSCNDDGKKEIEVLTTKKRVPFPSRSLVDTTELVVKLNSVESGIPAYIIYDQGMKK